MIAYLTCFVVSIFLFKISERVKNKKQKNIVIFIALIIPCALAGLRNKTVGTDVRWYTNPLFECAQKAANFSQYYEMKFLNQFNFQYFNVKNYEILFIILIYIITKLTGSFQLILFTIQMLIIFPIYGGLKKFKKIENKLWLSMLVFYFLFFNVTLNLMRQFIGISITFYGISCFINEDNKKGKIKFWIFLIIGTLFHKSALLGIIVYIIYIILNYQFTQKKIYKFYGKKINLSKILSIVFIMLSLFVIYNSSLLIRILNFGGLEYYTGYINGEVSFFGTKVVKVIPIIFIFLIVYKSFIAENKMSWFFIVMFLMEAVIISQFSSVVSQSGRIGYIFQIFDIVSFPVLCSSGKRTRTNNLLNIVMIGYLLFYWIYTFAYGNSHQTMPYILFF